jgi:hypothetical protein
MGLFAGPMCSLTLFLKSILWLSGEAVSSYFNKRFGHFKKPLSYL